MVWPVNGIGQGEGEGGGAGRCNVHQLPPFGARSGHPRRGSKWQCAPGGTLPPF